MQSKIEFPVVKCKVMGIQAYRGTGKLCEIATISKADVFDQKHNPQGTQRDLNIRHARDAYVYASQTDFAFWPEVVLCCRDKSVLSFEMLYKKSDVGILRVDMEKITKKQAKSRFIAISRLDGNHRLHFAIGENEKYDTIERIASFCLLIGLKREQEIALFRDINNNQRRMNTSHLDTITIRLTPDQRLMRENPALYYARRLGQDKHSPLYGKIFEGGKKRPEFHIPLRTLQHGMTYLRQKSSKLDQLKDREAEYLMIRNYLSALQKWVPEAWENYKEYLLLRGAGLWGACMVGGVVIDRCLDEGTYEIKDMLEVLTSGGTWDWSREGNFKGYSGRGGASEIANTICSEFATASGVSIRQLAQKIKSQ